MCPTNRSSEPLAGEWTHSHEEDEAGVLVYRRAESFPFPPTRGGRDSLRVDGEGQITALAPGPDDRPRPTGIRVFSADSGNADSGNADSGNADSGNALEIIEATENVLKIRRR